MSVRHKRLENPVSPCNKPAYHESNGIVENIPSTLLHFARINTTVFLAEGVISRRTR